MLVKISFREFISYLPHSTEQDLSYLLSGLITLTGCNIAQIAQPSIIQELAEYLRTCESLGISIHNFLSGSTKNWDEIRPKFQQHSRTSCVDAIHKDFSKITSEQATQVATYLLRQGLARITASFPFHEQESVSPIMMIRAQPDLHWNIVAGSSDCVTTLCTHFPGLPWKNSNYKEGKTCFIGVRFLSPLTAKTALVLQKSLSGLNYLSTTRVKNKNKFLSLAFYSETDANLFKFNLMHYAKFFSTHFQFFPINLSDYREGYPGLSGFFDENGVVHDLGLDSERDNWGR